MKSYSYTRLIATIHLEDLLDHLGTQVEHRSVIPGIATATPPARPHHQPDGTGDSMAGSTVAGSAIWILNSLSLRSPFP